MDLPFCSQDLEKEVATCLWSTVTRVVRALQLKTAETETGTGNGVGKRLSLSGQSNLEASRLRRRVEEERLVWRRTMLIMALLMCDCSDLNELLMRLMHNLHASTARGVRCKSRLMNRWIWACRYLKFWTFLRDEAEEKPHHRQKAYAWVFHQKSSYYIFLYNSGVGTGTGAV